MASLLAVGTYVGGAVHQPGSPGTRIPKLSVLVIVAAAGAACFLMVRGIQLSAWSTLLMETISIGILAVLMIVYFAVNGPTLNFTSVFAWNGHLDSLSIGIVVAVSAFVGFESPTTLGGEAQKPFVSVPRAITWTPILAGVLYLLAATAQDVALKDAPSGITTSSTPLSDLFSQTSPVFAALLDLGIAASWFACAIASVNALARIFFCMGREGVAPRAVGRTHPAFRTPSTAILAVMPDRRHSSHRHHPLRMPVLSRDSRTSSRSAPTGTLGPTSLPVRPCRSSCAGSGRTTYASWILGAATSLVLGAVLWMAAAASIGTGNLQTFIYGGVLLASVIYAMFLHRRLPQRLASVGIYDETRQSDLFHGGPFT